MNGLEGLTESAPGNSAPPSPYMMAPAFIRKNGAVITIEQVGLIGIRAIRTKAIIP
jgi:hypothetical protein